MPNQKVTLQGTDQSITRPLVSAIITQLKEQTQIAKDAKVFYPDDIQTMYTPGSTIDSTNERYALFATDNIVFIDVKEEFNKSSAGTLAMGRGEQQPIFLDREAMVKIVPIYATHDVTISIKYRNKSRTALRRWRDDMRMRIDSLRDTYPHTANYHYLFPDNFVLVLKAIFNNKKAKFPDQQTFEEYVKSNLSQQYALVSNMTGSLTKLAIAEQQGHIYGNFDFDVFPDKDEREEKGSGEISFDYKFSYEKPISCQITYPVFAYNDFLPDDLIPDLTDYPHPSYENNRFTGSGNALNLFSLVSKSDSLMPEDYVIKIPACDDTILKTVYPGTAMFMRLMTSVDETDKRSLVNLQELDDNEIDPDILQFIMESEYPYLSKPYLSLLNVALYKNACISDYNYLTCDRDLNIKSTRDLDIRQVHHLRLSITTDLQLLSVGALQRVMKYPKALVKIIAAINDLLVCCREIVELGDKKRITYTDMSVLLSLLTGIGHSGFPMRIEGQGMYASLLDTFDPSFIRSLQAQMKTMRTTQSQFVICYNRNRLTDRDI